MSPPGIAICARTYEGQLLAADALSHGMASGPGTDAPRTNDPGIRGQIRARARQLKRTEPLVLLAIGERQDEAA